MEPKWSCNWLAGLYRLLLCSRDISSLWPPWASTITAWMYLFVLEKWRCHQLPRVPIYKIDFVIWSFVKSLCSILKYTHPSNEKTVDRPTIRNKNKKKGRHLHWMLPATFVERVILKIVAVWRSISRITPHVAMLVRLQLAWLKTRR